MKLSDYGECLENASLKNYNTYGIDTSCRYLVKVKNIDNLVSLINYLNDEKISYFILGGGSNIILPDEKFNGVVVSLRELKEYELKGNILTSEAGVSLNTLFNILKNIV